MGCDCVIVYLYVTLVYCGFNSGTDQAGFHMRLSIHIRLLRGIKCVSAFAYGKGMLDIDF